MPKDSSASRVRPSSSASATVSKPPDDASIDSLLWQPEKLAQICASRSLPRPVGRDRRESTQHQFRCELVAFSADGRRARNLAQGHRRPLRRPAFRCLHRRLSHLQPPLRLRPDRVLCMSGQTLLWVIGLPKFGAVRMVFRYGVLLHHGTQPGVNLQLSQHRYRWVLSTLQQPVGDSSDITDDGEPAAMSSRYIREL